MPTPDLSQSRIYSATTTRRQFLRTSAAALSGLALSSCGWTLGATPSEGEVEPGANDLVRSTSSDELFIYTWSDYTDEELLASFTAKTGIKVIVDIFDSNEAMLAKIQAGGGSSYSIIYPSDYMVGRMVQLQLLRQVDRSRLVGLDNLFPKFQDPLYDPLNRYSIPFTWGTTGLIYNAAKLSSPPQDWDYLWQQESQLSRRVTLMNDVREVFGAGLRSLGFSYNSTDSDRIRSAYQHLVDLKPTLANFTTDGWRDLILAGDLEVAMGYSFDALAVSDENPDLQYLVPLSGSSLWTDTMVIPKNAPNVEGAYAWMNFMLQPEVSAALIERLYFATPNRAAYNLLPPEFQNNPTLFPPESILDRCEGILPLSSDKEKEYARYWIRLKSV
ncbi:ABC transporter substrate-binding protein [Phormidium sp. CCY1219]|uniref:ABC transporter substrate-binding protein n=1 Tax=Phormidium sp. CCY1219 TaxID=2886104 RepID=UPI002D1F7F3F|nr:spermidine/putrescine ABC transporter substrate-binding protein [Phormidium sp. CCY1219]MEB3829935.1 spermidine/putrescine ABC transporter substrate-binding protein [Phormidium sp. CCY1219]